MSQVIGTPSPPVGTVLHCLWVNLGAAHVLDTEQQLLPVSDINISDCPQVGLLHHAAASPEDLPAGVHGHGRFFSSQLRQIWILRKTK